MQTTGFLYWTIRPPGQKDGCNLEKHRIPKVLQDDHIFDLHLAQRHFGRPFMGKRGQEDETEIPAQTFLPVLLLLMSACCPVLWVDFGTYFHFWSNFFGCFFFSSLLSLLPRQPALHHCIILLAWREMQWRQDRAIIRGPWVPVGVTEEHVDLYLEGSCLPSHSLCLCC